MAFTHPLSCPLLAITEKDVRSPSFSLFVGGGNDLLAFDAIVFHSVLMYHMRHVFSVGAIMPLVILNLPDIFSRPLAAACM